MSKISGIYMLTFPSGKKYVGQSWDIEKRWYLYSRSRTQSPKLKNALDKYDFDDVKLEILEEINDSQEEMDERESYWILEHKCIESGYNLMTGGRGGKHSEESKIKMGLANKGIRRSPSTEFKKGQKLSKEVKAKQGAAISAAKKGKPLSDSHKEALRKPKNLTESQKENNRNRYKGKTWKLINGKRVWFDKEEITNE